MARAETAIPPAASTQGSLAEARYALGSGDHEHAITLYTSLLQSERLDPEVLAATYRERGIARLRAGAYAHAVADYTNAIWLDALPANERAQAFLARGVAHLALSQWVRASHDFESAIAAAPQSADAYLGRATARRLQGDAAAALSDFEAALERRHPEPHLVRFGRGLAHASLGNRVSAIAEFEAALAARPGFLPAIERLKALGVAPPADALTASPAADRPPGGEITLAEAELWIVAEATDDATGALPPPEAERPGVDLRMPETPATAEPLVLLSDGRSPEGPAVLRPSQDGTLMGSGGDRAAPEGAPATAVPPGAPIPAPPIPAAPEEAPDDAPDRARTPAPAHAVASLGVPAAAVSPPPSAPAPQAVARTGHTGYFVQLGAYRDAAVAERNRAAVAARFAGEAGLPTPVLMSAQGAGGTPLYRLRAGPVAGEGEARALCSRLKAQGQDCVIVAP